MTPFDTLKCNVLAAGNRVSYNFLIDECWFDYIVDSCNEYTCTVPAFISLSKTKLGVKYHIHIFSKSSMIRTSMASLPWLIRTRF